MAKRAIPYLASSLIAVLFLAGCSGPFKKDASLIRRLEDSDGPRPVRRIPDRPESDEDPSKFELPALTEESTIDAYLRYAALNNPGLESAFQEWRAALERIPQVRALPDPRLTYGYFVAEVETRVGSQEHQFGLSQAFPWFGELGDREDAASKAADALYQRLETAKLDLFYRVESTVNELYFLKRSIEITSENIELLQQFERIARARYRVAAANHPDIIRIQVELGKLEDRLRQLHDMRAPTEARLNAALNQPLDAELPWPSGVRPRFTDAEFEELATLLEENSPILIGLEEQIRTEEIRAEIARKEGLPDFALGLAYTVIDDRDDVSVPDNGDDALLASLSISLPVWRGKYNAAVREVLARRDSLINRRQETRNRLMAELRQALFDHQDAQRRIELYRDTLIPKATESLQASLTGFEQGGTDFLDLVDTERTLLQFQLDLDRATVDRTTSYALLERLLGTAVPHGDGATEPEKED